MRDKNQLDRIEERLRRIEARLDIPLPKDCIWEDGEWFVPISSVYWPSGGGDCVLRGKQKNLEWYVSLDDVREKGGVVK